ncbi:mitochondrial escape protein 2 [Gaertneriomyces sp. JEL0708]|nr:mitochondrial escape protein 2 [Gaertneriomyces sp. JEL0708]
MWRYYNLYRTWPCQRATIAAIRTKPRWIHTVIPTGTPTGPPGPSSTPTKPEGDSPLSREEEKQHPVEPTTALPDISPIPAPPATPPPKTPPPNPDPPVYTIWLDNIFPIRYFTYDPRWPFVKKYADDAAQAANARLIPRSFPHLFVYKGATPNWKEGGLFVHFQYEKGAGEAVDTIRAWVNEQGLRSWMNLQRVRCFQVRGHPWVDDMLGRLPSRILKVEFHGPDPSVADLYTLFRPFGRIVDISPQPASVKDLPRSATIEFTRIRSATSARNCLNQSKVHDTELAITYVKQKRWWESAWTWVVSHPRISVPVVLALLAGMTYLVFDPLRVFFITNKLTGRFQVDFKGISSRMESFIPLPWSNRNLSGGDDTDSEGSGGAMTTWSDRQQDAERLHHHLLQPPDTITLISGPAGSGKHRLLQHALADSPYTLTIHCDDLLSVPPHVMLDRFARMIGFKPMFNWLVQMSSMLDTMVTATTGAKAGLSTTNEGQVRKMLELLTTAMTRLVVAQKDDEDEKSGTTGKEPKRTATAAVAAAEGRRLGNGKEVVYPVLIITSYLSRTAAATTTSTGAHSTSMGGGQGQTPIYDILLDYASQLVETHLAHVILVTDNASATKTVSKALGNRTVEMIVLEDAETEVAVESVKRKIGKGFLKKSGSETGTGDNTTIGGGVGAMTDTTKTKTRSKDASITTITTTDSTTTEEEEIDDTALRMCVENLGGRLTDLESLITRVRSGMQVEEAYNDLLQRAISELLKLGLDPPTNDTKNASSSSSSSSSDSWTPLQFHTLFTLLTQHKHGVPYDALLPVPPQSLHAMSRAGLISLTYHHSRPVSIHPARPIYIPAYRHVLTDQRYTAMMALDRCKSDLKAVEDVIKDAERELAVLSGVYQTAARKVSRDVGERMEIVAARLRDGTRKSNDLNREMDTWKTILEIK